MSKRFWMLTLMMIFSLVFSGWTAAATPEQAAQPKEPKDIVIGVSLDKLYLGRQAEMKGVRDAAKEMGATLLEAVADNDPQLQNSQIESFIAQGVDVIMIVAVDMEAIKAGIQAAKEAGIPIVTFDRKVPDEPYVSYHSGLDSYADGYSCGKYVAEQNAKIGDNKPRVVLHLLGALNDDNAIQRRDGFEQALKDAKADNLKIIQAPMNWNADQALAATEDAFSADPNIWAVQMPHDGSLEAVMTALKGANRYFKVGEPGHVVTCAIDGSEPGYLATKDGYNDALAVLPLFDVGRGALEAAIKVAQGQKPEVTDQRFPGTLYTWEDIEANKDKVWGVAPLTEEAKPGEGITIGVSLDKLYLGRQAEMKGVRDAAKEMGATLLEAVADNDPQLQNSQIESFIAQGVDVIMIVAVDMEAIKAGIQAAKEAGIPIVTFDRKVPDEPYVSYHSGLDSYADGYSCGKYVAEQNAKIGDNKPRVVLHLLGALNDDNAIQRRDGFEQALKDAKADNLKIIQAPMNWNADQALAATEDAFSADPNIWAVQMPHDGSLEAVMTALKGANRYFKVGEPGHVVTCAIDGSEPGYLATKDGYNDALAVLPLFDVGRGALEAAIKVAKGQKPEVTDQRFPGTLYTWENIEANKDKVWGVAPLE